MRNPSIHLSKSSLFKILSKYFDDIDAVDLCEKLFKDGRSLALTNRTIAKITKTKAKSVAKNQEVNASNIELFNRMLHSFRQTEFHKNLKIIDKYDSQYNTLVNVASIAKEYADMYHNGNYSLGFLEFIKVGYTAMRKKFGLTKYISMRDKIFEVGNCYNVIRNDDNAEATRQLYLYWLAIYRDKSGDTINYEVSDKYCAFVYSRLDADSVKASYDLWVVAQYEELECLGALPEPYQMYGENAVIRYKKFIYRHNNTNSKSVNNTSKTYHTADDAWSWEDFGVKQ